VRRANSAAILRHADTLSRFQPSPNFEPLWTETARRILIRGPNRIGKTRHNCALIAQRALDCPGTRWRFVSPTSKHVQRIAGAYLAEFLVGHLSTSSPRSYYVRGRGWNGGHAKEIVLSNGSIIELLSYEDPVDAHEGSELDGVILDEPPPLGHLLANQSRLFDRRGQLIIGATMVNRPVQYLREMVEGEEPSPKSGRTQHESGWVQYVGELSIDACPWKSEEEIAEMVEILGNSPWQYAQRVEGAWEGVTEGRRFMRFTEANVSNIAPSGEVKVALAFDHGTVVGHEHTLQAMWRGTKLWIWAEHTNETAAPPPEQRAKEVTQMLKISGVPLRSIDFAVGDTNSAGAGYGGWRMNEALEHAFASQLNSSRVPFRIQYPDKSPGSKDWQQRCINYACARGDLKIHPRCTRLIDTMRNWQGKSSGESDDANLAHAADALGYLIIGTLGLTKTYSRLRFH
jgi:hypothetical protein